MAMPVSRFRTQAKKSIRGLSLRQMATPPPPPTPALHSVIVETEMQSAAIRGYFRDRREQASQAVPKPVLSAAVLKEMSKKLRTTKDVSVAVKFIVPCLEEFASNHEKIKLWCELHTEISQLLFDCFSVYVGIKKNGNFQDSEKSFTKFCNLLKSIADYSQELSTELFIRCSKELLNIHFSTIVTFELQMLILETVSCLCQNAKQSAIVETLTSLSLLMKYVARQILKFTVETQSYVYYMLRCSASIAKVPHNQPLIWFGKWPTLKDSFILSCSKPSNEGCGLFLNELFNVRKFSDQKKVQNSGCMSNSAKRSVTSVRAESHSAFQKCSQDSASSIPCKGDNKLADAMIFKTPGCIKKPTNVHNSVVFQEPKAEPTKRTLLRKYQTPYYPDRKKSLGAQETEQSKLSNDKSQLGDSRSKESLQHFDVPPKQQFAVSGQQMCMNKNQNLKLKREPISQENISSKSRKKKKVQVDPQSPLLNIEDEDETSKVSRWLSDSVHTRAGSFANTSFEKNDSPEIIFIPNTKEVSGLKRQASQYSSLSKRVRDSSPQISLATGISSLTTPRKIKTENKPVEMRYEDKIDEKTSGKRKLYPVHGKEAVASTDKKEEWIQIGGKQQEKATSRSKNLWEDKLKKLESKSTASGDVYSFRDLNTNVVSQPRKPKKPRAPVAVKSPATRIEAKSKKINKENIRPSTDPKRAFSKIPNSANSSFFGNTPQQILKQELKKTRKGPVKLECYSPAFNDSLEVTMSKHSVLPQMKRSDSKQTTTCAVDPVKQEVGRVAKTFNGPTPGTMMVGGSVPYASTRNTAAAPGLSTALGVPGSSGLSGGPTLKFPTKVDGDSGVETSGEGDCSKIVSPAKGKYFNRDFLQMQLKSLMGEATQANLQMTANQTSMTSEFLEIKGLAEKIAQSASRCQNVASSSNQILSDQAAALESRSQRFDLEGNDDWLGFKKSIRASIQAKNNKKIMESIKKLLEKPSDSSSDS